MYGNADKSGQKSSSADLKIVTIKHILRENVFKYELKLQDF